MIAEALEVLSLQAQEAAALKQIATNDPRNLTYVTGKGETIVVELPPGLRRHKVESVDDLIAAASEWGGGEDGGGIGVLFHNESKAVLVADDGDRRDTVELPLSFSDIWQTVCGFRQPVQMDQRKLIRLLKFSLYGCTDGELLKIVQKIESTSSDKRLVDMSPGRERGVREFQDEIISQDPIPDVLAVNIPVYSTPGIGDCVNVLIGVEVVPRPEVLFTLQALPDQLTKAIDTIQGVLGDRLAKNKAKLPVFYGSP